MGNGIFRCSRERKKERKKEEEFRVQTWFKQKSLLKKGAADRIWEGICCRLNEFCRFE
jgi:hypothetical protein